MVNGNTSQGQVMDDIVDEILLDLQDENGKGRVYGTQLIERLEAYGFMIVPIEDPTNLRFGVEDD